MSSRRVVGACLATAAAAALCAPSASARPIEHFVVLMQENHSFDNYFGTYPEADGLPANTCMPVGARSRPCVRPFHLGGRAVPDVGHDRRMHRLQAARGRMDGFVRATSVDRQRPESSVMGWYDRRDLPFYWNVAREYVLFDRFFASAADGTEANHNYWVSGKPDASGPTIFDRLDERGISWKFYVEDLGPNTLAVRVPLLGTPLSAGVVDLAEYYEDLDRGRLPHVAYIVPAGASEHPPGRIQAGQTLVRRLLTALWKSDAWERSAFLWTYDNWGGWFDHVTPPAGRGFRVPALLVSPYARRGEVDSTTLETASIPRFIEDNWDLEPLGRRDREANGLAQAFDFSQPPRAPAILPATAPGSGEEPEPRRWGIYLGYGSAALLGALLFVWTLARPASRVRALAACMAAALIPLGLAGAPDARGALPTVIQTVPEVPGMRFAIGDVEFEADANGRAYPPPAAASSGARLRALPTEVAPGTRARFDRWYRHRGIAAIELYHLVRPTFVDLQGRRVDPEDVGAVTLRGSQGRVHVFEEDRPQWLQGNRVIPESQGTRSTGIYYSAEKVVVSGSNVVHRSQQRFFPARSRTMQLRLLLFAARITVRDALLGFPIGSTIRLEYPNGGELSQALGPGARLVVGSLPRGDYRIAVDAPGISSSRPIALSRDQDVELRVISWLDVLVVLLGLASVAVGLLYLRRPVAAGATTLLAVAAVLAIGAPGAAAADPPDPLFAYYYIWFNASSWERAKTDYPMLGRYSSDDREVMLRHVKWAKRAGIDGFIVSWKSTPVLDRRLARLAEIAAAERFRLLVIYQGLDFEREPLPAARVARDLDRFVERHGHRWVFRRFGKPLVIWSGTWRFTRAQIAGVTSSRRGRLLILASERNEDDYGRVADLVDGDAYYWGSVNPATFPGYPEKLAGMGEAVHARGGIWIAPAAPGFDARLVGGTEVVRRAGGATLRTQFDAATASSPDAVGLISWNEFSENTHVEPSRRHGSHYLRVVGDVRGARLPRAREFDSSEPAVTGVAYGLPLLAGIALFFAGTLAVLLRRTRAAS